MWKAPYRDAGMCLAYVLLSQAAVRRSGDSRSVFFLLQPSGKNAKEVRHKSNRLRPEQQTVVCAGLVGDCVTVGLSASIC